MASLAASDRIHSGRSRNSASDDPRMVHLVLLDRFAWRAPGNFRRQPAAGRENGALPEPLFVDNISAEHQYMPAVLQSLPLPLVAAAARGHMWRPGSRSVDWRDLGAGEGGRLGRYGGPSAALAEWIITRASSRRAHQPRCRR